MITASKYRPRIFPINGDVASAEIDRAQAIDSTISLNRDRIDEIGREDAVGYMKKSPTVGYKLTQLEYGSMEFFEKLVNSESHGESGEDAISNDDFKESYFDICAFLTDDDGTFRGTMWYPALRTAGFSITIGDPQAMIERSFDFVGEQAIIWQGVNKYLIVDSHTCETGDDNVINLTAKTPVVDPDNAGVYMLRVIRVSGAVSTELALTTDYTYNDGTQDLTILSVTEGDVIKYWYTYGTEELANVQFSNNDSSPAGLLGDCASIYLYVPATGKPGASDYVYRVQSISFDVKFDREDLREIGNKNVVQRGIKNTTVTATLGRILDQFTIEEVLRGEASGYGKIDVAEFSDDISLIVKIFTDNTKSTLAYGFRCDNMSPTDVKNGATTREYVKADTTLEGQEIIISSDTVVLGI